MVGPPLKIKTKKNWELDCSERANMLRRLKVTYMSPTRMKIYKQLSKDVTGDQKMASKLRTLNL